MPTAILYPASDVSQTGIVIGGTAPEATMWESVDDWSGGGSADDGVTKITGDVSGDVFRLGLSNVPDDFVTQRAGSGKCRFVVRGDKVGGTPVVVPSLWINSNFKLGPTTNWSTSAWTTKTFTDADWDGEWTKAEWNNSDCQVWWSSNELDITAMRVEIDYVATRKTYSFPPKLIWKPSKRLTLPGAGRK